MGAKRDFPPVGINRQSVHKEYFPYELDNIRNLAYEKLSNVNISSLPINTKVLSKIALNDKILITFINRNFIDNDFFSLTKQSGNISCYFKQEYFTSAIKKIEDYYIIFVNKKMKKKFRNYHIAKSLGHIYLGHVDSTKIWHNQAFFKAQQNEAEEFTLSILIPEGFLKHMLKNISKDIKDISKEFCVPKTLIEKRYESLKS